MKEHMIDSNGIGIQVYEYSQKGEPLVFLHYMGGSSAIWRGIIPSFIEKYHVIAIDLRGHGKSDQPETGYQLVTLAEDVRTVLDTLGIKKVNIVGSSLGCYVGTKFASIYPERVLSLVNSEGALVEIDPDKTKEEHLEYFSVPEQEFESKQELIQFMKETWLPWNKERERVLVDYEPRKLENGKVTFTSKKENLREIAEDLYDTRISEFYNNIQCRVLFLPAEKEGDLNKKLQFIKSVEPNLKNSSTVVIPGTSHAMMFDHPKELIDVIINFFDER
ncbi:alpha/beta hydrolase [Bacillus carboniphilus]|uniref:Alpha/beta hydrolase n=1 Tax=Bacillus carboniphilus TaxID=86663 RepID=A0ABY9JU02_9BACI|nr:alpha/beta hydrolase [Bacillus carboniphilus]WLR41778.1 alpha/beta hydrolase [Bacillus carboniphilus]